MKKNYRFDPAPLNTHMLLMEQIPENSKVLEIGTASGYLGEYMIHEKHCDVWGIEVVESEYKEAVECGYKELLHKSAEELLRDNDFTDQKFDVILLGDVLEHMVNPGEVLFGLKKYLKEGGKVVISMPNIAHYTTRWHLLTGNWQMQDSGILDRTHLRFFTRDTAVEMIKKAGYELESARPSSGYIERFGINKLFGIGRKALFAWPTLFGLQYIYVARPKKD